jgi:hypothetical protein
MLRMIPNPYNGAIRQTRRLGAANHCGESSAVPRHFPFVTDRQPVLGRGHELFQGRGVRLVFGEVRVLGKNKMSQVRAGRNETILSF